MVDRNNLTRVTQLYEELRVVGDALDNLANGGVITNMTISGGPLGPRPPDQPPSFRMSVMVPTVGIEYPPGMTASITAALQGRQQAINSELTALGVT